MSFKHLDKVLESDLPSNLKMVAVVLAEMADRDTGECWPSYETIARRSSTKRRQAMTNIRKLTELGVISLVGKKPCESGATNVYKIHLSALRGAADCTGVMDCTGAVEQPNGVQPTTPKPPRTPSNKYKGAKRCPADFFPTDEQLAALAAKYPTLDLADELEAMKDHEYQSLRKDWPACFRTWCRNAVSFRKEKGNGKANGKSGTAYERQVERIREKYGNAQDGCDVREISPDIRAGVCNP